MRRAIYAGSFDPVTNGHLWMFNKGKKIFDELIIAIGVNPDKKYYFSLEDRIQMMKQSLESSSKLIIDSIQNQFLVNYAKDKKASFILRGIRNENDYSFERNMRHINSDLNPEITTVFLMPPRNISEISSSFIKGLVGPAGWEEVVKKYVPEAVFNMIKSYHSNSI